MTHWKAGKLRNAILHFWRCRPRPEYDIWLARWGVINRFIMRRTVSFNDTPLILLSSISILMLHGMLYFLGPLSQ